MENSNPYRAPEEDGPAEPIDSRGPLWHIPRTLELFRQQTNALGVLWAVAGVLGLWISAREQVTNAMNWGDRLIVAVSLLAVASLAAGIGAVLRKMWALLLGLLVSISLIVACVLAKNICAAVIPVLVTFQAVRVLRYAKQLRDADVLLTTHPAELD